MKQSAAFDGHDAAINLMRRLMQSAGAAVIDVEKNRSVAEIVDCIALTSYQGRGAPRERRRRGAARPSAAAVRP